MEFFDLSIKEYVATLTINHEPANTLSSEVLKELSMIFDQLEASDEVRVILLHGKGRFFSAGADIKEFLHVSSGEEFTKLAQSGQALFERIETFPKPVIAVIHGAALGGGLELAMACHLRLVAEDAKLGLPELQLGIIPGFGGTQRLPKYVGPALALEMMGTSEPILGRDAVKIGLANHVYQQKELLHEARKLAGKFAEKSPLTIKAILSLLNEKNSSSYGLGMKKEAESFGCLFESEDAKEGIAAFVEKRKAVFKGK